MVSFAGPAEVKGMYQKLRNLLQPALIVIFLAAPWIQIQGQPMVLLDFFNRHFIFFGSTFYSHEAPLLFFLVILLILSIFFVTAVYGRLWCGWVCPQTVFLQSVFNRIEHWIFGSYTQRIIFYKNQEFSFKKLKIFLLYIVFFSVCWLLSHSLMAYFVGAYTITQFIYDGPAAHMTLFTVCMVIAFVLFFNFTFFREKLCVYVCPYGRFQNALIDRNSLVVSYDSIRGEPRGKMTVVETERGDCVDCNRCVHVCPVKIDIRNGFQFDCISCGQCIDACDSVMQKLNRPQRLIRYETGNQKPITLKRFRLVLYGLLIVLFLLGFLYSLAQRSDVDFNLTRSHQMPFASRIENGQRILQNQIQLHIKNQTLKTVEIFLKLNPENQKQGFQLVSPAAHMQLDPGQDLKTTAFIEISDGRYAAHANTVKIDLQMENTQLQRSLKFLRQE